jgi:glutathionyl-hydroquinone reductase
MGPQFTDADLRFPTIVRYDAITTASSSARYRIAADFPDDRAWMRDSWLIGSEIRLAS